MTILGVDAFPTENTFMGKVPWDHRYNEPATSEYHIVVVIGQSHLSIAKMMRAAIECTSVAALSCLSPSFTWHPHYLTVLIAYANIIRQANTFVATSPIFIRAPRMFSRSVDSFCAEGRLMVW